VRVLERAYFTIRLHSSRYAVLTDASTAGPTRLTADPCESGTLARGAPWSLTPGQNTQVRLQMVSRWRQLTILATRAEHEELRYAEAVERRRIEDAPEGEREEVREILGDSGFLMTCWTACCPQSHRTMIGGCA
jgi:hypothetical protein